MTTPIPGFTTTLLLPAPLPIDEAESMRRSTAEIVREYGPFPGTNHVTRVRSQQFLELRVDATNVLNHASFGFPTLTTTSATFGRIFNSVATSARQIQLGVKYSF